MLTCLTMVMIMTIIARISDGGKSRTTCYFPLQWTLVNISCMAQQTMFSLWILVAPSYKMHQPNIYDVSQN